MADKGTLPYYAVELDSMTFQGAEAYPTLCPSCGKEGVWVGKCFVPDNEQAKGYPRCYCRTIHRAGDGAYAYDPEARQFLRRPR